MMYRIIYKKSWNDNFYHFYCQKKFLFFWITLSIDNYYDDAFNSLKIFIKNERPVENKDDEKYFINLNNNLLEGSSKKEVLQKKKLVAFL